jgi:hypothetical protein
MTAESSRSCVDSSPQRAPPYSASEQEMAPGLRGKLQRGKATPFDMTIAVDGTVQRSVFSVSAHPFIPLQSPRNALYSPFRSEFLNLRRWSLGLRRWT